MRVLIAENEVDLAAAVRAGLVAEGLSVDVVHDGLAAYQRIAEGEYDVVILDLMMPHLSGYRVIERARSRGIETPILVLTAKTGVYDQTEALDAGADDYVTKPFPFAVLVARVRALVRRTPASTTVTVGELELDRLSRSVTRAGRVIDLTSIEFAVLEALVLAAGLPVSKADLLREVWDGTGTANQIEAHVHRLRTKVDAPFEHRMVQTVRHVGYRLVPEAPHGA